MTKTVSRGAAVAALILAGAGLGAAALAQQAEDGPRRGPGGDGPRWERMFERLDADGDGRITQDEIAAARENRFAEMDADGDGAVTAEEMVMSRLVRRAERRIARLDQNGDGVLQIDELPDGSRRIARLDLDENGVITRTEARQAARFMRRGEGRRFGRGHHRGFGDDAPLDEE